MQKNHDFSDVLFSMTSAFLLDNSSKVKKNILTINFSRKGLVKGKSNYILGKIQFIFWISIHLHICGHFVPILSINNYDHIS